MTAKRPGIRRRWIAWTLLILALGTFLSVSGCMERLFYWPVREATPPPAAYQGVERVRFSSADGTPLVGWFIPAQRDSISTAERPAPTIIHAHGNAGSINDHLYFSEYLPEAGFNLFLFDYRGFGESGGKARRRADLIADTHARQQPEDKLAQVRQWQQDGEVVAVVGDGLNDGPVLSGGDVSIAMGAGVQAARASADIILLSNRLGRIPEVAAVGDTALANIRQNLNLSFAYNILVVPLAALGWVAPWMAAILMPASSLVVVLNALRLRRQVPSRGPQGRPAASRPALGT